ncbi:MAG: hypothetical protein AAGI51_01745 [Pseudomonadota bacterium]
MPDLKEELSARLRDPGAGWSVGSFGAIAEFHQDPDEPAEVEGPLERATARGAIRIDRIDGARAIAWEALSKNPVRWQQGVAVCLPAAEAMGPARQVVTELGPDEDAIRPADRGAILFDMGLGQANVDFCVRTSDPALIETLRASEGRSLAEPGNPATGAILRAHPHRVALSSLARCEVFQKIGGPDTGGVSPAGPHTHVLPELMKAGRTHSANIPVPEGYVPALNLHPASPVADPMGEDRAFDPGLHAAFQELLAAWGPEETLATKTRVLAALEAGDAPEAEELATSRLARAARRIALRQHARTAGGSGTLAAWSAAFDRGAVEADADAPGH